MTTSNVATKLHRLIQQLHDERAEHIKAIEAIDKTFRDLGLDVSQIKPVASAQYERPANSKNTVISCKKRTRRIFSATADVVVLSFIQANPDCTTAQVNEHWAKEGRNGKADQTCLNL